MTSQQKKPTKKNSNGYTSEQRKTSIVMHHFKSQPRVTTPKTERVNEWLVRTLCDLGVNRSFAEKWCVSCVGSSDDRMRFNHPGNGLWKVMSWMMPSINLDLTFMGRRLAGFGNSIMPSIKTTVWHSRDVDRLFIECYMVASTIAKERGATKPTTTHCDKSIEGMVNDYQIMVIGKVWSLAKRGELNGLSPSEWSKPSVQAQQTDETMASMKAWKAKYMPMVSLPDELELDPLGDENDVRKRKRYDVEEEEDSEARKKPRRTIRKKPRRTIRKKPCRTIRKKEKEEEKKTHRAVTKKFVYPNGIVRYDAGTRGALAVLGDARFDFGKKWNASFRDVEHIRRKHMKMFDVYVVDLDKELKEIAKKDWNMKSFTAHASYRAGRTVNS